MAIILGLHLTHNALGICDHIKLSIVNQATIKILNNNHPQSAQYLIDKIKRDINKIHAKGRKKIIRQNAINQPEMEITLTWVSGHMGSTGNKAADDLAKEAAEFGSSNNDRFFADPYQPAQLISH